MRVKYFCWAINALLFFSGMLFNAAADAEIYIFKDKNGRMVITDSPPNNVEKMEMFNDKSGASSSSAGFRGIGTDSTAGHRQKSDNTSLGTVTVKKPVRRGSGSKDPGVKPDMPAPKEQRGMLQHTAAQPPVITRANSAAFKFSDEVIRVPVDIEGR
ncbi:MAG: DUF4124 domain-containing protein [Deltaproteobacteria bacterium]|nr:DUF4124 domain-containing protein [Deltaproteobacteria bacterium]